MRQIHNGGECESLVKEVTGLSVDTGLVGLYVKKLAPGSGTLPKGWERLRQGDLSILLNCLELGVSSTCIYRSPVRVSRLQKLETGYIS